MKVTASLRALAIASALFTAQSALAQPPAAPAAPAVRAPTGRPVTDAMLKNPDAADWLMWRRTLNDWGFSPLAQVNRANVGQLRMVWSRGMGPGSNQATPLVHDGIMYLPNPADVIQAMDAASGDLYWEYKRQWPEDLVKVFPTPTPNRNLAIYGDKIISGSADDYMFAIDQATGKLAWETQIVDFRKNPAQKTAGPIVANGKIFSGRGCEPKGGSDACVVTAHDARTGKELWRFRNIPAAGQPGYESWGDTPDNLRLHVGAWMPPSYDPELNLVFFGTSVTSPAPKYLLAGNDKQYLYHNSTLALDADTGKLVWYYQHVVDHWDMDHPFERYILDTTLAPDPKSVSWINPKLKPGERRKVISGIPGKTGIFYTLDAKTGEFLWATPTVKQTIVSKIDGATGKVTVNPAAVFDKMGDMRMVCPSSQGGKNWPAGAYSPLTKLMFFPLQNTCTEATAVIDKPSLTSLYGIRGATSIADGKTDLGMVQAISPVTGKTAWKYQQRAGTFSVVATQGGLVFVGDANGRFRALDQTTGKVLWEVNLGSAVSGFPVSYAVKGKQYIAVVTGGNSPQVGGLGRLTPELHPSGGNNIFVFALPDAPRARPVAVAARTAPPQAAGPAAAVEAR